IEDGELHILEGGYGQLQAWLTERREAERQERQERVGGGEEGPGQDSSANGRRRIGPRDDGRRDRGEEKAVKEARRRLAEIEGAVEALTARKEALEQALSDPATYAEADAVKELTAEHRRVTDELAA